MSIKVKQLKEILQPVLDELDDFDDNDEVHTRANTYGLGDEFIALGYKGYVPLGNFDIDYASDAEESKKYEGTTAHSLFDTNTESGHSKIYDELSSVVDAESYSGALELDDEPSEYPESVDLSFFVGDDSGMYSVNVYIYSNMENDEESTLSYSIRDEYNNNLKSYISAAQGAPLGYQKGYKISELSKMWDDIAADIRSLAQSYEESETEFNADESKKHESAKKVLQAKVNEAKARAKRG